MKKRATHIRRKTRETDIAIDLNLDGTGESRVATGVAFMDHMLELLAKHSLIDLRIKASGDLHVDYHHTVEDLGLTLGMALDKALADRKGIRRYGWALVPMDESLSRAAIDLGGRPYLVYLIASRKQKIRDFDVLLIEEFFQALVVQARMNLHVQQFYGAEPHHAYESVFKAVARALRQACDRDPRVKGVPSSKGKNLGRSGGDRSPCSRHSRHRPEGRPVRAAAAGPGRPGHGLLRGSGGHGPALGLGRCRRTCTSWTWTARFRAEPVHTDVIAAIVRARERSGRGRRRPAHGRRYTKAARRRCGACHHRHSGFAIRRRWAGLAAEFGPRLAVGIDARDGMVQVRGWVTVTAILAVDLAGRPTPWACGR